MTRRQGFTLAEVLITLGIIGVVAAITMPVLIQNYQKQVTAEGVKKAYSELNQIIDRAKADHGDPSGWDYYEKDELEKWVQTYIEPYVNVVGRTTCGTNERCLGLALSYPLSVKPGTVNVNIGQYVITKPGIPVAYAFSRKEPFLSQTTVLVYIRNPKKYAFIGKDVFAFHFDKSTENPRFLPRYLNQPREVLLSPGTVGGSSCNRQSGSGYTCSTIIMLDGWKISKDYPW